MHSVCGYPDVSLVCTYHVERQNLNIPMGIRRMTRFTNAFSKKRENHEYYLALYFFCYDFCRLHATLSKSTDEERGWPTTPAMAAGLTDHVWGIAELLNRLATQC
jgi:hypothetical protein